MKNWTKYHTLFALVAIPVAILTSGPRPVFAQGEAAPPPNATVFGVNVLVGALTAATRAVLVRVYDK